MECQMGGVLGGCWGKLGGAKKLGRARKPAAEWASTLCKHLVGSVGKTLVGIWRSGERRMLRQQAPCCLGLNGALALGSTAWQLHLVSVNVSHFYWQ